MINNREKKFMFITSMISIAFAIAIVIPWNTQKVLGAEIVLKVWVLPLIALVFYLINLSEKFRNYRPTLRYTTVASYFPLFVVAFATLVNTLLMLTRSAAPYASIMGWLWMVIFVSALTIAVGLLTHFFYRVVITFSKNEMMLVDALIAVFYFGLLCLGNSIGHKYTALESLELTTALLPVMMVVVSLFVGAVQVLSLIRLYKANPEYQVESKKALIEEFMSMHKREYDKAELHILQNLFKYSKGQLGIHAVAVEEVENLKAEKAALENRIAELTSEESTNQEEEKYREKLLALQERLAQLQIVLGEVQIQYAAQENALAQEKEELEKAKAELQEKEEQLRSASALLEESKKQLEDATQKAHDAEESIATRTKELEEKEAALVARHQELVNEQTKIEEEQKALEERANQMNVSESELQKAQEELTLKEQELAEKVQALENEQAKLEEEKQALENAKTEMAEAEESLKAHEAELQEKEQELKALQEELESEKAKLEEAETKVAETEETLNSKETELQEKEEALSAKEVELQETEETLNSKEAELEAKAKELEEREAKAQEEAEALKAREAELAEKEAELEAKAEELNNHKENVEVAQKELEESKQQLEEAQKELEENQEQFEKEKSEYVPEVIEVIKEVAPPVVEKPKPEPKPMKVIKPSYDELLGHALAQSPDIKAVPNSKETMHKLYYNKKLILIMQRTNSDYRITFLAKNSYAMKLLNRVPGAIVKPNSPKGDNWFKITNKGDIKGEILKEIITKSYEYLVNLEAKAEAKKKVFKPSFDKMVKFASNIPDKDIKVVPNAKGNQYKFYLGKKLFLVALSTSNDYRLTFCATQENAYPLIIKYPNIVVKATSPKGEEWFKITNKSELDEKELKTIIKNSIKFLEDQEAERIRIKEEEIARKKALKEEEMARRKAERAEEAARRKAEKEEAKRRAKEEQASEQEANPSNEEAA